MQLASNDVQGMLERFCDQRISPDDFARLDAALLTSADTRRRYREFVGLHALLQCALRTADLELIRVDETAPGVSSQPVPLEPAADNRLAAVPLPGRGLFGQISAAFHRPVLWSALGVGVVFAAYFVAISWNLWRHRPPGPAGGDEPNVAIVSQSADARWSQSNQSPAPNNSISAGVPLSLAAGFVELQLQQGAILVIEGPAEWTIEGPNRARLNLGKMVARVPKQAIGFQLNTPVAKIVDLGTEFAVAVNEGDTEVHVLKGEVETQIKTPEPASLPKPVRLRGGEAVRVSIQGGTILPVAQPIAADRSRFSRTLPSSAESRKPQVKIEAGDGTPQFRFPTLPSPSNNDAADTALGHAKIRALGPLQTGGNNLSAEHLLDGIGAGRGHVRFEAGKQGMFLVDLGLCLTVSQIVSFSWHMDGSPVGAPQAFDLFGSAAEQEPALEGYLPSRGWRHLASVNTEQKLGSPPNCPSQQAVSVSGRNGQLGEFRYLLWVVTPLRGGPTYFDELDVFELADTKNH